MSATLLSLCAFSVLSQNNKPSVNQRITEGLEYPKWVQTAIFIYKKIIIKLYYDAEI